MTQVGSRQAEVVMSYGGMRTESSAFHYSMRDEWTWEKVWFSSWFPRADWPCCSWSSAQAAHCVQSTIRLFTSWAECERRRDWGCSSSTPRRVGDQWPSFFPIGLKSQNFYHLLVALPPGNQAWTRGPPGELAEWKVRWLLSGYVTDSRFPLVLIICGARHSFPPLSRNKDCLHVSCVLYLHPHRFCFFMS